MAGGRTTKIGRKSYAAFFVFCLISATLILAANPTNADSGDVTVMQEGDDPRVTTYQRNITYFYGDKDSSIRFDQWPMWTHAQSADANSDDDVWEQNQAPLGDPNFGGGPRDFTFRGEYPANVSLGLDEARPITGFVTLDITCPLANDACSKQTTIVLRLGENDIAQQTIEMPDDQNRYNFEFYHGLDEIPAGEVFGLRVSFTKGSQEGDGYTLYMGQNNIEMFLPILQPYEERVPGLELEDGESYVSPYSKSGGFIEVDAASTSWFGLIFFFFLTLGILVGGFALMPAIPFKEAAIVLTGLSLMTTLFILPLISGPMAMGAAADVDDPSVYSIDELAAMDEREGTFLGDDLLAGNEFQVWVSYKQVYTRKNPATGEPIWGLGFEKSTDSLSDTSTGRRGKEFVQLYFSMLAVNPAPGQGVLINVKLINYTDVNGISRTVPQWADPNAANAEFVQIDEEFGGRWLVWANEGDGGDTIKVFGIPFQWRLYPLIATAIGLLLGGVGFWMSFKTYRKDGDEDDMPDEDIDAAIDDLDDPELLDFDDDELFDEDEDDDEDLIAMDDLVELDASPKDEAYDEDLEDLDEDLEDLDLDV